ncbi:MAG TPA: hypothetical protein VHB79_36250 [Polyangiaceae bacterium]|nr:hypothetical protein [Polyangiaceae bacterium]
MSLALHALQRVLEDPVHVPVVDRELGAVVCPSSDRVMAAELGRFKRNQAAPRIAVMFRPALAGAMRTV